MRTPFRLLLFLARAALPALGGGADDGPAPLLPDRAREVWARWSRGRDEPRLRAELQALTRAPACDVARQADRIAGRVASGRPAAVRESLLAYLEQAPAARQGLRRPADPTGTTAPPTLPLRHPNDLLRFLLARLPRFRPGDRPAGLGDGALDELLGFGGLGKVWRARPLGRPGPDPVLRRCRIDREKSPAVWVHDRGLGTVEDCDLTGGAGQAWKIEQGCEVRRSGNRE